jgi:hypothetical protein
MANATVEAPRFPWSKNPFTGEITAIESSASRNANAAGLVIVVTSPDDVLL